MTDPAMKAAAKINAAHLGPIMSTVPGRTDRHHMDVLSGSYVIPSESVSHLGENNTLAGMEVLKKMFPHSKPRTGKSKVSAGAQKSVGGVRGQHEGDAVPVVTAGGEFVVSPDDVKRLGKGDLEFGHKILDAWILNMRKKHIATLRGLAPPARD